MKGIYEYFKKINVNKKGAERLRARSAYDTIKTKVPYKGWLITKI
jgi:CRISPR/Cas system-associated protein Cas10 (large subunit of type III CRISPR-Cas system)